MNRLEEQITNAQSDEEVIRIFADAGAASWFMMVVTAAAGEASDQFQKKL